MRYFDLDVRFPPPRKELEELNLSGYAIPYEIKADVRGEILKVRGKGLTLAVSERVEPLRQAIKRRGVGLILLKSFRPDVGIVRMAHERGKVFEIPLSFIIESKGVKRALIMARMRMFLRLCIKYDADFAIVSRAQDIYGLRSPRDMIAIGEALGLEHDQAERAITEVPEGVMEEME